jgi:hypothetical protein
MKILDLVGQCESGKTTSLQYFTVKVLQNYECKIIKSSKRISVDSIIETINDFNDGNIKPHSRRNFTAIIEINGIIIGVTTLGDELFDIFNKLKIFREYKCAIGVCASHPSKRMRTEISADAAKNNDDLIEIFKEKCGDKNNYDTENRGTADLIFDIFKNQIEQL